MAPYQENVLQEFQVSQGTFSAKAQGSLPNFFTHIWVIWCLLRRQNNISIQNSSHKRRSAQRDGGKGREEIFYSVQMTFELQGQPFLL